MSRYWRGAIYSEQPVRAAVSPAMHQWVKPTAAEPRTCARCGILYADKRATFDCPGEIVPSPLRPHRFEVYEARPPLLGIWDLAEHRPVRRSEAAAHTHMQLADEWPFQSVDRLLVRRVAVALEEACTGEDSA